jgi:hypothetical protein
MRSAIATRFSSYGRVQSEKRFPRYLAQARFRDSLLFSVFASALLCSWPSGRAYE